jgi:hypothetical protein
MVLISVTSSLPVSAGWLATGEIDKADPKRILDKTPINAVGACELRDLFGWGSAGSPCFTVEWQTDPYRMIVPTPSEGLNMKSVFPPDTHRLQDFYETKNEVAIKVETQPTEAEDTDSNEIDLTPNRPAMTVAVYKFRRKLESL